MREPTYFILLSLVNEPLHGYAIAQKAKALSDGRVTLAAGTLYGALDRLAAGGEIAIDHEEAVEGRKRRYYRLEESGRSALAAEAKRMSAAARLGQKALRNLGTAPA